MRLFIPALIVLSFLASSCATVPHSGRSQLNLVSDAEINQLAAKSYQQILKKEKPCTDARLTALVERVAGRIIRAAEDMDAPGFDWEVRLIEKDEANAFCLPGGKIVVYTGILKTAENEAGLAAVIGHEVAHAVARHGAERMSQELLISGAMAIGAIALDAGSSPERRRLLAAIGLGANVGIILPFSRRHEEEADEIGLFYMARAGYDPSGAPKLWARMKKTFSGKEPPVWLSTHPSSAARMENLRSLLPQAMEIYRSAPEKHGTGEKLMMDD